MHNHPPHYLGLLISLHFFLLKKKAKTNLQNKGKKWNEVLKHETF